MDLSTHGHSPNFCSCELSLHAENLVGPRCPCAGVRQASGLMSWEEGEPQQVTAPHPSLSLSVDCGDHGTHLKGWKDIIPKYVALGL